MGSWVDFDSVYLGADYPFHAGLTRTIYRANLAHALSESGHRLACLPHGSDTYAEHTFAASDVFEDMTPEFGYWPLRSDYAASGLAFRQLRVVISGRIVHASASAPTTVRFYALDRPFTSLELHPTGGILGHTGYGDVTLSTSTWTTVSTTIDVLNATRIGGSAPLSDAYPTTEYHEIALHAVATGRATQVRLRAPMLEAVP